MLVSSGGKYVHTLLLSALVVFSIYLNISVVDHAKAVRSARAHRSPWLTRKVHAEDSYCRCFDSHVVQMRFLTPDRRPSLHRS